LLNYSDVCIVRSEFVAADIRKELGMRRSVFGVAFLFVLVSPCLAGTLYVSSGGASVPPYDSWANSANQIQHAVDAAISGDTVLVSNGVYYGWGGVAGSWTNVVVLTNGIALRSLSGPAVTTIHGGGSNRCVYLEGSNTVLDGFTLTGGEVGGGGGGAYAYDYALLTNCLAVSNSATYGGGAYIKDAIVDGCAFETNTTTYSGGGLNCREDSGVSVVRNCKARFNVSNTDGGNGGGGIFARHTHIDNCVIEHNATVNNSSDGGGMLLQYSSSYARNCLAVSNVAGRNGGGIYVFGAQLDNCTAIGNYAGSSGGGVAFRDGGVVKNSIIYHNMAAVASRTNLYFFGSPEPVFTNCCVSPLTNATDSIDADPLLTNTGRHLRADSPCIDAGTNQSWMVGAKDIGGNQRVFADVVDIGADEVVIAASGISGSAPVSTDWMVTPQAKCQLQFATNLTSGSWSNAGAAVTAQTASISMTNLPGAAPTRFYRLAWEKP